MAHSSSYEILELPADATLADVRAAYRRLAPQVHPDRGGSHELFRLVQEAYDTLSRDLAVAPAAGPTSLSAPPKHDVPALGRGGAPVRGQCTRWVDALLAQERRSAPRICVTA